MLQHLLAPPKIAARQISHVLVTIVIMTLHLLKVYKVRDMSCLYSAISGYDYNINHLDC